MNRGILVAIVAAAVVFVGAVGVSTARKGAEERRTRHALLDSIEAMRQRNAVDDAAMEARFGQIDIDRFLKPDEVVQPAEVAAGRAELAKYRATLVDRDRLAQAQLARAHDMLAALPQGEFRDGALQGEAASSGRIRSLRATLTMAQNANADAVEAMFDWADRNHAIIQSRGGHLVVYSPEALADLRAIGERIHATGASVTTAIGQVKAHQSQSLGKLQDLRTHIDD